MRWPVAAKIAFTTAGASGGMPISPKPDGLLAHEWIGVSCFDDFHGASQRSAGVAVVAHHGHDFGLHPHFRGLPCESGSAIIRKSTLIPGHLKLSPGTDGGPGRVGHDGNAWLKANRNGGEQGDEIVDNRDPLIWINQGVHTFLAEKGVPHIWRLDGNAHDTAVMSSNFYHFAQRLFKE